MHSNNKDSVNNHTHNIIPQQGEIEKYTGTRVSQPNPPVSDRETCPRGLEGLVTQAVVATSARDMSFGTLIGDHSP